MHYSSIRQLAIVLPGGDQSRFFRAMGDPAVAFLPVARNKPKAGALVVGSSVCRRTRKLRAVPPVTCFLMSSRCVHPTGRFQ